MGEIVVSDRAFFAESPVAAFQRFGASADYGWLLSARFDDARAGALAEMRIPVPGEHAEGLRGTGRIVEYVPYRRIVIRQESPWAADTVITFTPRDGGTDVRATSTLTSEAIGWMNERIDAPFSADPADASIDLGLVCSLSGEAGLFGRSILNCARLAADEINADGGLFGRPVRIVHVDEATSGEVAIRRLDRILATRRLAAVIGSHTSSTLNALRPRILRDELLYLYAPVNEGFARERNLFRLGESSKDQLRYAVPELARRTSGDSWYVVGNDYSWPREIARVTGEAVGRLGGRMAGSTFVPFGGLRVDDILEDIERSGADMLVSALIGYDSIDFERAFVAAGLRSRITTLAPLMEDSTLEHLGTAADGIWSSLSYFGGDAAARDFQERYLAAWGPLSPPPSAISASVYDSVHLWARAARRARSLRPSDVATALIGTSLRGARGDVIVTPTGTLSTDMYLARIRGGTFDVLDVYRTNRVG